MPVDGEIISNLLLSQDSGTLVLYHEGKIRSLPKVIKPDFKHGNIILVRSQFLKIN